MNKVELKNDSGEAVATIAGTKSGVWIVLEGQESKPQLAFDVEPAGVGLMIYPSSDLSKNIYPALAFSITDDDVRIQLHRPGKKMVIASLFDLVAKGNQHE